MADLFDFRDHVRMSPSQARWRRRRRQLLGPRVYEGLRRRPSLRLPGWGALRLAVLGGVSVGLIVANLPSRPMPGPLSEPDIRSASRSQFVITDGSRPWDEGLNEKQSELEYDQPSLTMPMASPADVQIIDGDTFRYRGVKVRIAGIDTPETFSPRCPEEAALGARATARLRQLLGAGPFELGLIDRDEDVYGRKLRTVSRNGADLGDVLIAEGLARPYGEGRRSWCA